MSTRTAFRHALRSILDRIASIPDGSTAAKVIRVAVKAGIAQRTAMQLYQGDTFPQLRTILNLIGVAGLDDDERRRFLDLWEVERKENTRHLSGRE